jgi:alpha-tubulin suppressor-like RCC1 family protein
MHTCAVEETGAALCWGSNSMGQLGTESGSTPETSVPITVSNLPGANAISAGYTHTCAVTGAGTAHCWGTNTHGQLGNPNAGLEMDAPVMVQDP